MGAKLEQWRKADQQAHAAEMSLCALGRCRQYAPAPQTDVAAVKGLRQMADRLFDEAMQELQAEIAGRFAGRLRADSSH